MNDLGLLGARLALGLGMASHGAQKAFGWYGGPGLEGAAGFMESLGFKPGDQFAKAAAYTEMGSGLAIVLGIGGPAGPAALIATMLVAQTTVHAKNGFFAHNGGVELGVVYGAGAVALASSGYGKFSLDNAFGLHTKLSHPVVSTLALVGGFLAGRVMLSQRDTSPPDGTMATPTFEGAK